MILYNKLPKKQTKLFGVATRKVYNFDMQRVKLEIEYDGTSLYGWQRQKKHRSVQGEIESALGSLFGKEVLITGSSRTDAGVHALGQVAHLDIDDNFPAERLSLALNPLLPDDVKIVSSKKVSPNFNARFDVDKKTYIYLVSLAPLSPIKRNYYAFCDYPLNYDDMKKCAEMFLGTHYFKGFCASAAQVKNYERTILQSKVTKSGSTLKFIFTGNGFMQHMVRIFVGTIIDVGRGKLSLKSVAEALESGDRSKAGKTMPPNGLYLKKIVFRRK